MRTVAILLATCIASTTLVADDAAAPKHSDVQLLELARSRVELFETRADALRTLKKIELETAARAIERAKIDLRRTEAVLEAAAVDTKLAETELARMETIRVRGAIPESSVSNARAALTKSRSRVEQLDADRDRAATSIESSELGLKRVEVEFVLRESEARLEAISARMELIRMEVASTRAERFRNSLRARERDDTRSVDPSGTGALRQAE